MSEPVKKKALPAWAVVLIVLAAGTPVAIGIFSAVAIFGLRKYMLHAKRAEATSALTTWGGGLIACAMRDGLPLTSPAVPASLTQVSGKKYQSAASEWSDPAFSCAGFSLSTPQYFQYQWVQLSPAEGDLIALGDLDGDGSAEERLSVHIACSSKHCTASTVPAP
jgi:hypothetical protein